MSSVKVNALPIEVAPLLGDRTINDSLNLTTKTSTWQSILNLFNANGVPVITSAQGIVAAGTNQATATALTKNLNRVDTVGVGEGVKDAVTALAGYSRTVQNNGANDLLWYPFGANQFYEVGSGAMAAGSPITIAPGNQASYFCYASGQLTLI